MKKLFFVLFVVLTFSLSLKVLAKEVVLLGDDAYPPYSYLEDGVAKGVYVDVIRKVFDKIDGYEVKFDLKPWKRCIKYVKEGKNVGFFPPYFSEERNTWTEFSEPILEEQVVVYGKAEKLAGKTVWPNDFFGCLIRKQWRAKNLQ